VIDPLKARVALIGKLASHPRGRTLVTSLGAVACGNEPEGDGVCLAFASEFQDAGIDRQKETVSWTHQPGRTLLLLPPLKLDECKVPVAWRVINAGTIDSSKNKGLSKLLSAEIKYELITEMQPAKLIDGEWSRGGINTAYYKKHPNSGLVAITTLPLWSLTTLDHQPQLTDWLGQLHSLTGQPIEQEARPESEEGLVLSPDHFALMLHLMSGSWRNRQAAMRSLRESVVLSLPEVRAMACMVDLENGSLAVDGKLTAQGKLVLQQSPYRAYAATLENEHE
jgi:hypothetical protein